jgi:methylmalonyl-CoA mutase, N-terminal domain
MERTASGLPVDPFYRSASAEAPGQYPFSRGIHEQGYRTRLWTMRQYSGFGDAKKTNERFRYLLEQGQTGLSTAFDLPTQLGLDSDDPRSLGEVGRVGVGIDTIDDMERLFRDIPLADVSVSMTINATAAILLAMYLAVAERQGVPYAACRGTVQNDILKEYVARGNYIFNVGFSMRLTGDVIAFAQREIPKYNSISISGYHIREAGANAVQELAFTFANAKTYVEYLLDAGLKIDDFAHRLSFFFNVHNDFFEETAKFRAARRIWAKLMKEKYGAQSERSMKLRFHAQTAGSSLTAQAPENNIVRVSFQAMAAVLGGAQSLHTNSFDEALALPTEHSAKLALRTQQVLAHESGITQVADPLGGSHYVEYLTDALEERANQYLDEIDRRGGALACIENGYIKGEIEDNAYAYQLSLDRDERKIVGVNCLKEAPDATRSGPKLLKIDPKLEEEQVERLKNVKAQRNGSEVQEALARLANASDGENMMPIIIDAVKKRVSVGEICDVFRKRYGEYKELM